MTEKIGFLQKETTVGKVENSSTNLNILIGAGICILAAITESATQLISVKGEVFHPANWMAIATLCAAILIGGGVAKVGRDIKLNKRTDV